MFCTDIRTDSEFCFIQHWLIGFYNRGGKCLLRGTDWFLIQSRLRFIFKRLKKEGEDAVQFLCSVFIWYDSRYAAFPLCNLSGVFKSWCWKHAGKCQPAYSRTEVTRHLRSVFGEDAECETLEFLIKERDVGKRKPANVKRSLCTARIRMGGVEIEHHSFLISALDEGKFYGPPTLFRRMFSRYRLDRKLGTLQSLCGLEKTEMCCAFRESNRRSFST